MSTFLGYAQKTLMDFKQIKPVRFTLPKKPPKVVMVLDSIPHDLPKQERKLNSKKPKKKLPPPTK
jgi:hypothetical protein